MPEPKDFHLFLLPNLDNCPESFRPSLMEKGFSTELCSKPSSIAKRATAHRYPIIVANCGDDEDKAIDFVKGLVAEKSLFSIPLLLIGGDANSLERAVQRFFPVVAALNTPFLRNEGLAAIDYLIAHYPGERAKPSAKEKAKSTEVTIELPQPETALPDNDIRTLVFTQLSQLPKEDIGGTQFKIRLSLEDLDKLKLLPEKPSLQLELENIYEKLPQWSRDHMCRTIFVVDSFHKALMMPEEVRVRCRNAAPILFSAFNEKNCDLLERNYLYSKDARKELASKLKDSALHALGDLKETEISKIISTVARFIEKDEAPDDSLESLSASLLVAAELLDRACFEIGYWNPRSAYTLIRSATSGKLDFIHPLAAACMMKFLAESLAEMPKPFLIKHAAQSDAELQKKAKENEEYMPARDEEKIPLDNLEPGMKLSKPIFAYDGRKILSGEIQLDQDLIWRLWRLSAIRPMNTPLVVKKDDLN